MNTQPHRHLCSSDPSSSCWASSSPAWNSPWNSVLPVPATLSLYLPSSNLGSSETKHENLRLRVIIKKKHLAPTNRHISSEAVSSIKCCSVAHDFADDCFLGASSLVAIRPCCLAVWREHHLPQTCAIVANQIESILLISIQSWAGWWWKFHQIPPGLIDLNGKLHQISDFCHQQLHNPTSCGANDKCVGSGTCAVAGDTTAPMAGEASGVWPRKYPWLE